MASAPDRDLVELKVGGRVYGGWKTISIEVDLDAAASSFELGVTERWQGQPERWAIEAGAPAQVTIGGEPVITGYVDALDPKLDGTTHSISVTGRSKAADLIDSSAIARPGSWRGRRLEQIAIELVEPFGLAVIARSPTGAPFRQFALQQGETVWEAIQRMCRHRGLLVASTREGDVEIFSPEPRRPAIRIEQGVHPVVIAGRHDVSERFSEYIVKGQSAGDDSHNGRAAASPRATASDPGVPRYRPLIVVADDQVDVATARRRAEWEAVVRAARAQEANLTLPLWRRQDGELWWPQAAVDLVAPAAWIEAEVMVAGVKFAVDDRGKRVELRLVRPEAYTQLPVPEEAEASRIRRGRRRRRREPTEERRDSDD